MKDAIKPEWFSDRVSFTLPRLIYAGPQLSFREFGELAPNAWTLAYVYHLFTEAGDLLYVGMSAMPRTRWEQHAKKSRWWPRAAGLYAYEVRGKDRNCADRGARHWESVAIHRAFPLENRLGPPTLPYKQRKAV